MKFTCDNILSDNFIPFRKLSINKSNIVQIQELCNYQQLNYLELL